MRTALAICMAMAIAISHPPAFAAEPGNPLAVPRGDAGAEARALTPQEIFRTANKAVVIVHKTGPSGKHYRGTGFFIAPKLVATNHHVIENAAELRVEGAGERHFEVTAVRASDPTADTAILEVAEDSPDYIPLDPSRRVDVGETVYVIGNPQGYARSLSQGLVSGIRNGRKTSMYQITANVSQGSSGSPVLDAQGRAIGIVFGRLPHEAQIAFATPAAKLVQLNRGRPEAAALPKAETPPVSRRLPPEARPAAPDKAQAARSPRRKTGDGSAESEATSLPDDKKATDAALGTIRIGVPDWDSALVSAHVLKQAIEKLFPVGVELIPGTNAEIFEGVNAADRSYDVHPDVWLPNHDRFVGQGGHLTPESYTGVQGLCVPRYVAERHSVRRRDDLNEGGISRLFDTDGDGRGEIWIGQEDWEATKIERLKARDYGYGQRFDLVAGAENDFYRKLDRAISARQPIAFYCYGPHWIMRKYQIYVLREHPYGPDCFRLADDEAGDAWYDHSQASCAAPPSTVHRYYSDYIARELPGVAAFIDGFSIGYEDVNELIFRMMDADRDGAAVAAAWVRKNRAGLSGLYGER